MAQSVGVTTTYYALDTAIGLPEVLYTSDGNAYLHLPGVIVTENTTGTVRYLLSDGLGSVRHAVDENAAIITYKEFDPYGNPLAVRPHNFRPCRLRLHSQTCRQARPHPSRPSCYPIVRRRSSVR